MLLMDKLLLFALGITCLTLVLLYVFMKNRFEFYDNKIDLLFNVYQKLAMDINSKPDTKLLDVDCSEGICRTRPIVVSNDDVESDSEDSCSVNTDESEDESYEVDIQDDIPEIKMEKIIILKQEEPEFDTRSVEEIIINKLDENNLEEVPTELSNDVEKKTFSKLTVKELKQLIADVHGPSSLKTKQEMIQYLENN
jgi:hypothetical protein